MSSTVTPASGSQRPRRKPLSVRARLYLLAIVVAVPACIYIAHEIRTDVRSEFSSAEQFMTVLARITAVDTEQFLDDSRVTMTRIARRMVMAEAKLGTCDPLFRESFSLLQRQFGNLGLADSAGVVLCTSAARPKGKVISVANRGWFKGAVADNPFVVSETIVDMVTGETAVAFGVPVRVANGEIAGALGISLTLAKYKPVTNAAPLSPGSIIAIVNGDGIAIASSIDPEHLAGMNVRDSLVVRAIFGRQDGLVRGTAFDHVERIYAFARIKGADWYALAGVPIEQVHQVAMTGALREGGFALLIVGLLAFLSWYVGRTIERPIRAIAHVAREVAAGRLGTRGSISGPAEVEDVAIALNEMLDVRASAETALRESEAQRASIIDSAMDAIVTVDDRQSIVIFNKAAQNLFHCAADEAAGRHFDLFLAERDRAAYRRYVDAIEQAGKSARLTAPLSGVNALRAGGEEFPVEASISQTIVAGRKLLTVILRDITERRKAESRIEILAANLEKGVAERTVQLEDANAKLRQYTKELAQLGEISDQFQACMSVQEATDAAARFSQNLLDTGGVFLINASRNLVEANSTWGEMAAEEQLFKLEDCLGLRRGKAYLVNGSQVQARCHHVRRDGSFLCVPLIAQGETLGILHLRGHALDAGQGNPEDLAELLRIVQSVAERTALAVANLRLRQTLRAQSIRDPLTNLFNRRFLEETLDMQEGLARRKKTPIGLMMLDVDGFKAFNDRFGHDAGDQVLRDIAKALQTHTRGEDIACRYGGEEFCVVLPGAAPATTHSRAEQLRQLVAEMRPERGGISLGEITISIGIATFPDHGATGREVLLVADAALYQAKHQGRNRVVVAGLQEDTGESVPFVEA